MTREEVQIQALNALLEHGGGTVVLDTGTGKSKVAVDFIKKTKSKKVCILVPRTVLVQNWNDELMKWGIKPTGYDNVGLGDYYYLYDGYTMIVHIVFSTIQGIYDKQLPDDGKDWLVVADEIHSMASEAYKHFFMINRNAKMIGLTATPEDYKPDKAEFYRRWCPIVYRYGKAAVDHIINGRKYFVLRTNLSDVKNQIDGWKYPISEKQVLEYWNEKLAKADEEIQNYLRRLGRINANTFANASTWCWNKRGTPEEQKMGWSYLKAVSGRKELLLNQNTTIELVNRILQDSEMKLIEKMGQKYHYGVNKRYERFTDSGVLVFSNQIFQIQKILNDQFIVHSKKKKDENEKIIYGFNHGLINVIGSCESLGMGMNFKKAKIAIFESYVGSHTKASQKMGRTDRLPIDENAIIIILYVNDSPYEGWYRKSGFPNFDDPNVAVFTEVSKLKEEIEKYV